MFTVVFSFIAELGDATSAHLDPPVINEDDTLEKPKSSVTLAEKRIPDPMYCFTCAVGKKPSNASMYVTNAQEVADALVLLAKGDFAHDGTPGTWDGGSNQSIFS